MARFGLQLKVGGVGLGLGGGGGEFLGWFEAWGGFLAWGWGFRFEGRYCWGAFFFPNVQLY